MNPNPIRSVMFRLMNNPNHRFFTSGGLILLGALVANVLNYLFNLVMGRLMQPEDYGTVVALVTLTALIGPPAGALSLLLAKRVPELTLKQQHNEVHKLFQLVIRSSWIIGGLFALFIVILSPWLAEFFQTETLPFAIFGLLIPASLLSSTGTGMLQGLERFSALTLSRLIVPVSKLAFSVALVVAGYSVSGVCAALVVGTALSYWYSRWNIKDALATSNIQDTEPSKQMNVADVFKTLASSSSSAFWFMLAVTTLIALFTNIDVIIMKHFLSEADAGQFSALAIIGRIVTYGSTAIVTVLLPMAASAHARSNTESSSILMRSLAVVGATGIATVAVFVIAPELIVRVLFGSAYISIAPFLGLFGVAMFLGSLSLVLIHYLIAINRRAFLYPFVLATFLLIGLLWFIHGTFQQIVLIELIANAFLLISLVFVCIKKSPHTPTYSNRS